MKSPTLRIIERKENGRKRKYPKFEKQPTQPKTFMAMETFQLRSGYGMKGKLTVEMTKDTKLF